MVCNHHASKERHTRCEYTDNIRLFSVVLQQGTIVLRFACPFLVPGVDELAVRYHISGILQMPIIYLHLKFLIILLYYKINPLLLL